MNKKPLIIGASLLAISCSICAAAFSRNATQLSKLKATPELRTLSINNAPIQEGDRYYVTTSEGTKIYFKVIEGTFTPGGEFGTLHNSSTLTIEYDQEDDVIFSNLQSVSIVLTNSDDSIYYSFYYVENHKLWSYGNSGCIDYADELTVDEVQVEIYNDSSASSTHTGNPNMFQLYTAGLGDIQIGGIAIKYYC